MVHPQRKGSDVKGDTAHVLVDPLEYTVKQYTDTCKAQLIQTIKGRLSSNDYINYVQKNWFQTASSRKPTF